VVEVAGTAADVPLAVNTSGYDDMHPPWDTGQQQNEESYMLAHEREHEADGDA
jgi:hypothetical protein